MSTEHHVTIEDTESLEADLVVPEHPKAVVLLVHGSGSSRLSPRNQFLAQMLRDHQLATLLLELETTEEKNAKGQPNCAPLGVADMAHRIIVAAEWLKSDEHTLGLPIGYLGAGTGAAAVMMAAAERPDLVCAIVSRGGRMELAQSCLSNVRAPVLLIVGSRDTPVVHHNREALDKLGSAEKKLEIVPGARHLFEEPGTLAAAALHASAWLKKCLCAGGRKPAANAVVHLDT